MKQLLFVGILLFALPLSRQEGNLAIPIKKIQMKTAVLLAQGKDFNEKHKIPGAEVASVEIPWFMYTGTDRVHHMIGPFI